MHLAASSCSLQLVIELVAAMCRPEQRLRATTRHAAPMPDATPPSRAIR
jgi:hypothetical protein